MLRSPSFHINILRVGTFYDLIHVKCCLPKIMLLNSTPYFRSDHTISCVDLVDLKALI